MVQLEASATQDRSLSLRRPQMTATFAVMLLGAILFYLGWVLPSIGGSVIVPTTVVFGVGVAAALVGALVARTRPRRWALYLFPLGAVLVSILGAIWTFQFSLPTSIQFSNATTRAELALSQLKTSLRQGRVVPTPLVLGTLDRQHRPLASPLRRMRQHVIARRRFAGVRHISKGWNTIRCSRVRTVRSCNFSR